MWDLAGHELTGRYGTWCESTYELAGPETETITLVMSAEQAPGPDWVPFAPDAFYGEGLRWSLTVPRSEMADLHSTIVQGVIEGVFVDLLAQRCDGAWAIAYSGTDIPLLRSRGLDVVDGLWSGWVPAKDLTGITRARYIPMTGAC